MNTKTVRISLAAGFLAGVAWIIGCGPTAPDRPATYPVSGTVTYDGKPVEGATVAFSPATGKKAAFGTTDASGKYTLTTFVSGDGALPGDYKVKIAKYEQPKSTGGGEGDEYVPPEETPEGAEAAAPKNLLPAKYANPATSGLTATVTEEPNTIDFPLK